MGNAYIKPIDVTPEIAIQILDMSMFSIGMSEMDNHMACLLAAIKIARDALEREVKNNG